MKLRFISLAAIIALSGVSLTPVLAATTASKTSSTMSSSMTVKSKTTKAADSKRFATEAAAQAYCPTDTVVWVNLHSKIFHLKGTATYGKGKNGVYMCKSDAVAEKFRPTKKPEKTVTTTN